MESAENGHDDNIEASFTGSTGGASTRQGASARTSSVRAVPSKFMQTAPTSCARRESTGREAFQLRGGSTMGPLATPATGLHVGRSVNLNSTARPTGMCNRNINAYGHTPGMSTTSLTAASAMGPRSITSAMDSAGQERLREQLERFREAKAQRAEKGNAAATNAAGSRVPPVRTGGILDNTPAAADGSKSARGTGGVYNAGNGAGAPPLSARGNRVPGNGRTTVAVGTGAGAGSRAAAGAAGANPSAKAPPVPRISVASLGGIRAAEQQLRTAVNLPLPKDEAWEAVQGGDGQEDILPQAVQKTPSSRITKSPRLAVPPGAAAQWFGNNQSMLMPPPPPPSQQQYQQQQHHHHQQHQHLQAPPQQQHQQQASAPPRSPPPLSARGQPVATGNQAGASAAAASADGHSGRLGSNADASTSDTGGRSIRDQIKMARLQELQWRVLKAKTEAAARARIEKGQRQIAACAMLLADMEAQNATAHAALATAEALKHTRHVLAEQLPLLEQWHDVEDTHKPATREVLTALQNAMTSLPLVNGAALGTGGDKDQALAQLRRALANGLGSLQSVEGALGMLLKGVNPRASAGGGGGGASEVRVAVQSNGAQGGAAGGAGGGAPAMAALLPEMHKLLVGEVEALRELLSSLNTLAAKLDEVACLRARSIAMGPPAAGAQAGLGDESDAAAWAPGLDRVKPDAWRALAQEYNASPGDLAANAAMMDRALAMLGLGVG